MVMNAKELLAKVKALFDVNPAPPAVTDPPAPAPTTTAKIFSYPVDGGGAVYVDCSDDGLADIDTNDKVYSDPGATIPYADGTYKVTGTQFGFTVAGGIVSAVTDAAGTGPGVPLEDAMAKPAPPAVVPPAPAPAPAPATPVTPKFELTPEGAAAMFASFATGTSDERIANLEVVCKALMENCFGWQLREAQQKATADQAILVYQSELKTAQAAMTSQKAIIDKQDEKLKGLFELVEEIVKIPSADPKTLTGPKKDKFEKQNKAETRLEKMGQALKELKEEGQPA